MANPSDTPFRLGYRAGRAGDLPISNPYPDGSKGHAAWRRGWGLAVKVGRGKANSDPWCVQPADCKAKTAGKLCRSCKMKKMHADPAFRARRDANLKAGREKHFADPVAMAAQMAKARAAVDPAKSREAKRRSFAKLNADPEFQAKRAAGTRKAFQDNPERAARAGEHLSALARDPKVRAKMHKTRQDSGEYLKPHQRKKIAMMVRETMDSYAVIGDRFGTSASTVCHIATEAGVGRGQGWNLRKRK